MVSKGNIPWNKGLTKEDDDRIRANAEAISKAKKGKPNGKLGIKHTDDAKKKMSIAKKELCGIKHPHWSGGTERYWRKQARKVVEEHTSLRLGNMRKRKILIHHTDGNIKNIDPTNLMVMMTGYHATFHKKLRRIGYNCGS